MKEGVLQSTSLFAILLSMSYTLKNQRLLQALQRQPVDKTPIWLMRQAGRFLPEYRALREKAGNFMTLCSTPELACEATLQPLRRFDLDAAILFSDILTIPDAMGLGLYFEAGEGPKFKKPLRTARDIAALSAPDPHLSLGYVLDAIKLVKPELRVPLIGFSGSPWTLATYMIEGGSSKHYSIIKKMLWSEPDILHSLLSILVQAVTDYLNMQIEAGVDVVMLFDSWGGVLGANTYGPFSLDPMKKIIKGLHKEYGGKKIPVILFTKNGHPWLEAMSMSGADALGIDWGIDMSVAYTRTGHRLALQGNMDPAVLYASPDIIVRETRRIIQDVGNTPGYIFNLGHGMLPNIPFEHVHTLIETVHAL